MLATILLRADLSGSLSAMFEFSLPGAPRSTDDPFGPPVFCGRLAADRTGGSKHPPLAHFDGGSRMVSVWIAPGADAFGSLGYRQRGSGIGWSVWVMWWQYLTTHARKSQLMAPQSAGSGSFTGSDQLDQLGFSSVGIDLLLEMCEFLQRTFSQEGELLRAGGVDFATESCDRAVHAFHLIDGLPEICIVGDHVRTLKIPLRRERSPRTCPKKATYS